MKYKGYTIAISISPGVALALASASYTIFHHGSGLALAGIVTGALATHNAAYRAAEQAARRWIDARNT